MTSEHNSNYETQLDDYFSIWRAERRRAFNTGDYSAYQSFLQETKKAFGKVYAGFTHESWISVFDEIFGFISKELERIKEKTKERRVEDKKMNKAIKDMTDQELLDSYRKGKAWLNTEENQKDEAYWNKGLRKVERLEDELQTRKIEY